jgi:hypothetical protein
MSVHGGRLAAASRMLERAKRGFWWNWRKRGGSEEALLFVNKKKQKNFLTWDNACGAVVASCAVPGAQKFFGSFFQKRTAFFSLR